MTGKYLNDEQRREANESAKRDAAELAAASDAFVAALVEINMRDLLHAFPDQPERLAMIKAGLERYVQSMVYASATNIVRSINETMLEAFMKSTPGLDLRAALAAEMGEPPPAPVRTEDSPSYRGAMRDAGRGGLLR